MTPLLGTAGGTAINPPPPKEVTQVELVEKEIWTEERVKEFVKKLSPRPKYKIGIRHKEFLLLKGGYSEKDLGTALGTRAFRSEVHRQKDADAFYVTIPNDW